MTSPAVILSNLSFSYNTTTIFKNASLQIYPHTLVGITGPNGSGKTTLLKLLMGFLQPSHGQITVFGKTPQKARPRIGYVPQSHHFDKEFPLTVLELVLMGGLSQLSPFGTYPTRIRQKAFELLDTLGLSPYTKKPFGSLSGGYAQRALLARALLSDPDLLLLDEPTANTDAQSTKLILDSLEQMKKQKTILLVTHDLKTTVERVDWIVCLQHNLTTYLPHELCAHFALGLYHPPLTPQRKQRPKKEKKHEPVQPILANGPLG